MTDGEFLIYTAAHFERLNAPEMAKRLREVADRLARLQEWADEQVGLSILMEHARRTGKLVHFRPK